MSLHRPRHRPLSRLLVVAAVPVVLMATGAGSAWALSDLTQHYYGLLVKSGSGVTLGEIDTTTTTNNLNQRLVTDSQGDRQQIKAPVRDRLTTNGNGVYTKVQWWANSAYCYTSGIGLGLGLTDVSGQISTACQTDWHTTIETTAGDYYTSTWIFTNHWQYRNGSMRSSAGDLRVCEDEPLFLPDICSGARTLGVDYD